jgi:hypothetical protein
MSKQEEMGFEIEDLQKEVSDLKYEVRTQTGLIVLLMVFNLCTVVSCLAYIWNMISK